MNSSVNTGITGAIGPADWGSVPIHARLAKQAAEKPNGLAVKDQPNRAELTGDEPRSLSWRALDCASDNLATQLSQAGIGAGDRVIVQLPNVVEIVVAYYAASKLGAILSPAPIQYGAHELQHIASVLEATTVLTLERCRDISLADRARQALPAARVLVFGDQIALDISDSEPFLAGPTDDVDRLLTVAWTSGTTGTPKGVPRSHHMWLASGLASAHAAGLTEQDSILCPFPLVNMAAIGGILIPALLHGCSITLHHPLDVGLLLQQLQDDQISFTIVPPAFLVNLAKSPALFSQYDLSKLRAVGSGSAPLSPWMVETLINDFGIEVINFYGSNEGISLYSTPANAPAPATRASDFKRSEGDSFFATKVADIESGNEVLAVGERGELLVRGATVFEGYWGRDNSDVFSADGFFRTGDLVELCGADGEYYRIVGRCKDIINRGGIKISPVELDLVLESFPGVAEAAVCAYPDERLSERVCACLVVANGAEPPTLANLQAWLLEKGLAKFKLPERIELVDVLPRTPVGKVQRFALEALVAARQAS